MIRVKTNSKFGYYMQGKQVVEPIYIAATDFHQGRAAVKDEAGWKFIDKKGNKLIDLDYDFIENGREGFWMVNKNRLFGMIDGKGEEIIKCEYKLLYKFYENRCAFSVDGFWGFFDNQGKVLVDTDYALVWDYKEGYARALGRNGVEILNLEGNQQFLSPSVEIRDFSEGLAPIQYMN
jgi:hypothetical protein